MAQPNFFIVGAPKCGTTALFQYLAGHPRVFVPTRKEPHFFSTDLGLGPYLGPRGDYLSLFERATENHIAVGEASPYYMYSEVAIPKIWQFNPHAKLIAMLRNPIDAVYSYHSQLLYNRQESIADFETAWRLQSKRLAGEEIPELCLEPKVLQYREVYCLAGQVQRLLQIFGSNQVKIVVFDDFVASTKETYESVLRYLGLPVDNRHVFPIMNENKQDRWRWVGTVHKRPPTTLATALESIKRRMGIDDLGIGSTIRWLNAKRTKRQPLRAEFKAELVEEFHDDVIKLSGILDRDLGAWLN